MPTASSTLSVPSKPGTRRPWAIPDADGLREEDLEAERDDDDADERGDHGLELAEAAGSGGARMQEGGDAGQQRGREEREARDQVDADRGADELGDVGRHRDHLGLHPEQERRSGARTARGRPPAGSCPVAIPSFALIDWISIAIRFATRTTQRSR